MIIDTKNCREIHFGNGTLSLGHDITGTIEIIYEKPKTPVSEYYLENSGLVAQELPQNSVCLYFDGIDGLKALDMLTEDLQKIKERLETNGK